MVLIETFQRLNVTKIPSCNFPDAGDRSGRSFPPTSIPLYCSLKYVVNFPSSSYPFVRTRCFHRLSKEGCLVTGARIERRVQGEACRDLPAAVPTPGMRSARLSIADIFSAIAIRSFTSCFITCYYIVY